ncbi:MAG: TetR family transcriptional regulator [Clostridiales bacterium]|nr:TetR family transcriptional regulator [Clostridiales bacterium]
MKKIIADAIKELMGTKPLAKISVSDIVEAADINRNSFYYHFKDKFDLVNWIFYTEITQKLDEQNIDPQDIAADSLDFLCAFLYENRAFYINALSVTGQNSFIEYFHSLLKELIAAYLSDMLDSHREFYATFFADSFSLALNRWLVQGAEMPPEELSSLLKTIFTDWSKSLTE